MPYITPAQQKMLDKRMSARTFGIELEHISKLSINHLTEAIRTEGLPTESEEGRREHAYRGWQIKGDGSISPQNKYPHGIEIASPPMTLKDYGNLLKVVAIAKRNGGVNASCGMHVHVHAPELQGVLVTRPDAHWQEYIKKAWQAVEPIMFSYMPLSRRTSSYCRPGISWGTKYMAINFSPLYNRRTIEFRLHNATLNPMKAVAFAVLCRNFIEHMVRQTEFKAIPPGDVVGSEPKLIHTRKGGEFYLQRNKDGKWLIEGKKVKAEVDNLAMAFKDLRKDLRLTGKEYLSSFQYPQFGNAMTELCKILEVNGAFRGFIEDRYDRMLKKYGVVGTNTLQPHTVQDEANFYDEPDYDPTNVQAPRAPVTERDERDEEEDDEHEEHPARW